MEYKMLYNFLLLALLHGQSFIFSATAGFIPITSNKNFLLRKKHCHTLTGTGAIIKSSTSGKQMIHNVVLGSRTVSKSSFGTEDEHSDQSQDSRKSNNLPSNRRNAVKTIASLVSAPCMLTSSSSSQPAFATTTTRSTSTANINTTSLTTIDEILPSSLPNFKCLSNLPPIPPDHVRLYLCRHGQTEFNRLKLIQGARIDAPLNDTGKKQATRLGKALSHIGHKSKYDRGGILKVGRYSNLLRARETASIAALTFESMVKKNLSMNNNGNGDDIMINDYVLGGDDETIQFVNDVVTTTTTNVRKERDDLTIMNDNYNIELQSLSTLSEVDFGPLNEGKSIPLVKADMLQTYSKWALGNIDAKMGGGGESGREVLSRAASALSSLKSLAANNGGSAVAVSHSTYIRMLIALVMDMSLTQAATLEQKNCCVNVLDISMKEVRKVDSKSNLFGIKAIVPKDFNLSIPVVNAVRINEIEHLAGLL